MRLLLCIGSCAVAALAACGQPYTQTSRGAVAYEEQRERCQEQRPLADQRPHMQPATECAERAGELARIGPYRRFLWVAPVPPPIQEAELDYLCVVPHRSLLEISAEGVFLPFGATLDGQPGVPPLPWRRPTPARAAWPRERLLRSVPYARDVRTRIRGTYRRIYVLEVFRQAHQDSVAEAIWYSSGDLDEILARPRGVMGTLKLTRPVQTVLGCGGRWLDFDVPPPVQVQSTLRHVARAEYTALAKRFEAALLENLRAQLRPDNENESAEIFARRLARHRENRTERLGLPLAEQQLRVTVQLRPVTSGMPGRDEIWSVDLPVNALLMHSVTETQSDVLRGTRYEIAVRLNPVEPLDDASFGDFSRMVQLDVTLRGEDGWRGGSRAVLVLEGTHDSGMAFVDNLVERRPAVGTAGSGWSGKGAGGTKAIDFLVFATIPTGPAPWLRPRSGEGRE